MNQEISRKLGIMTLLVMCGLFNKQIERLKGNEISQDWRTNVPCQQIWRGNKEAKITFDGRMVNAAGLGDTRREYIKIP